MARKKLLLEKRSYYWKKVKQILLQIMWISFSLTRILHFQFNNKELLNSLNLSQLISKSTLKTPKDK